MFKVLSVMVIACVTFLSVNAEQVSIFNLLSKSGGETNETPLISAMDWGNLGSCDEDPNRPSYFFDQVRKLGNNLKIGDTF